MQRYTIVLLPIDSPYNFIAIRCIKRSSSYTCLYFRIDKSIGSIELSLVEFIRPDLIRISRGVENIDDIIEVSEQGFDAAKKATPARPLPWQQPYDKALAEMPAATFR